MTLGLIEADLFRDTVISQGSLTAGDHFDSFRTYTSPVVDRADLKFDWLRSLQDNWDGRGSLAPRPQSILSARWALKTYRRSVESTRHIWNAPHISASEDGDVTLEWWNGKRKITIYFGEDRPQYILVSGPDIDADMEVGDVNSRGSFAVLWNWLHD